MVPDFNYSRYLAAKRSVDERARNRPVFEALGRVLRAAQENGPISLLEVGCGLGGLVECLWEAKLLRRAHYTGIDLSGEHINLARQRLAARGGRKRAQVAEVGDHTLQLTKPGFSLALNLVTADIFEFAAGSHGPGWDVLLAQAFLDLVDLDTALPRLLALVKPGGWFYFAFNFDGATILRPPVDPELDALIEGLYHATMEERRVGGLPAGSSQTGRRLFTALPASGGRILAAGSSDWVVFPGPHGYPEDEAYFLHFIVHTMEEALRRQGRLEEAVLSDWISHRRRQIDRGELVFLAHQMDFFGIKEG